MFCKRLESSLIAFAFGELDEALAQRVEEHTRSCPRCQRLLKEYELLHEFMIAGSEVPEATPSADALREAILSRNLQRSRGPIARWGLALTGASLAGALGVGLSLYWMHLTGPQDSHPAPSFSRHLAQAQPEHSPFPVEERNSPGDSDVGMASLEKGTKGRDGEKSLKGGSSRVSSPAGKRLSSPLAGKIQREASVPRESEAGASADELAVIIVDFGKASADGAKTAVEVSGDNALSFGS
jgi:hypothetical protein